MEPKPNLNRLLICSIEKKVVRLGTNLWNKHGYPIPKGSKGKATFFSTETDSKFTKEPKSIRNLPLIQATAKFFQVPYFLV